MAALIAASIRVAPVGVGPANGSGDDIEREPVFGAVDGVIRRLQPRLGALSPRRTDQGSVVRCPLSVAGLMAAVRSRHLVGRPRDRPASGTKSADRRPDPTTASPPNWSIAHSTKSWMQQGPGRTPEPSSGRVAR